MVGPAQKTAARLADAETFAGLVAHWAEVAGDAPALGDKTWAALGTAENAAHGPVLAIGTRDLAEALPQALAAVSDAAVLIGPEQPTKRAKPGEIILPVRRDGRDTELVRFSQASFVHLGRALADRYAFSQSDRVWIDGSVSDPGTWLIVAAAFAAGSAITFDPRAATIAWHLRGGEVSVGDSLRIVHLRAAREELSALQHAHPDLTVINGLALPEAAGLPVCSDPRDPAPTVTATVGRPLAGMEVMIVDPQTGMDMLLYQTGEVWLRGPGIMSGLANGIAPFEPGHFLRTGLLGYLDSEGRLVLPRTEEEALHITDE